MPSANSLRSLQINLVFSFHTKTNKSALLDEDVSIAQVVILFNRSFKNNSLFNTKYENLKAEAWMSVYIYIYIYIVTLLLEACCI